MYRIPKDEFLNASHTNDFFYILSINITSIKHLMQKCFFFHILCVCVSNLYFTCVSSILYKNEEEDAKKKKINKLFEEKKAADESTKMCSEYWT